MSVTNLTDEILEEYAECACPAVSGWVLTWKCSWWRTSLIKFNSVCLMLSEPIRQQAAEYYPPTHLLFSLVLPVWPNPFTPFIPSPSISNLLNSSFFIFLLFCGSVFLWLLHNSVYDSNLLQYFFLVSPHHTTNIPF